MDFETGRLLMAPKIQKLKAYIASQAAEQVARRCERNKRKLLYRLEKVHSPEATTEHTTFFSDSDHDRSVLSRNIRYDLLAYAYLRGREYQKVEVHCGKRNMPDPRTLFHTLVMLDVRNPRDGDSDLRAWLAGEDVFSKPFSSSIEISEVTIISAVPL